uniref:30S ribosomal protein S13 n=1 Tax=Palpitomonas bilix TaxID=652834 RepID=A0A1E1GHS7_9EUKA|nr:30S ribosomal protein S13 [Palpitomonas bilix]BAV82419.1 30S ribosomal protein S13 [Palpitomonas bilix]
MITLFGKNLKSHLKVSVALTEIFGINRSTSERLTNLLGFGCNYKISQLTKNQLNKLMKLIEQEYIIENDLRLDIRNDLKRLISINSYKGFRHLNNLPVNGQRTRTNALTQKRLGLLRNRKL